MQPMQLVRVVVQPIGRVLSFVVILAMVASWRALLGAFAHDMQFLAGQLDDLFQCLFEIHSTPRALIGITWTRYADGCRLVREHHNEGTA